MHYFLLYGIFLLITLPNIMGPAAYFIFLCTKGEGWIMNRCLSGCLTVALAAAMIGSLFACKPSTKDGPLTEEGVYGKYSEEVHFTTVRSAEADPKMPEGMTLSDNPYADYMKKDLNVTYEFLWEDSMYDDKLLMDMTTGSLPDIFPVYSYSMYQQLYLSDMLADLTDAYENYATDSMKERYNTYGENGKLIFDPVTEGGRLMALPSTRNGYQQELLWVRKDWLDILGLQPPKTIDEIAEVARKFVEQDPGGNGPGNTVGLNINREHSFNGYRNSYGLEPIANAMGAYPRQWMLDENGEPYYGSIRPEFKQTLAKVREWVDAGVIDQKNFEQTWEPIWDNVNSGKAGMWFFPVSWPTDPTFIENNPRAEVICYPAPLDNEGKVTYMTGEPFEMMLCVRKGYEHPEVIFKVFHLYEDMETGAYKEAYDALEPVREANTSWYYIAPLAAYCCRYDDQIPRDGAEIREYVDNGTVPELFTEAKKRMYDQVKSWVDTGDGTSADWSTYMFRYVAQNATDSPECNPVNPLFFVRTKTMIDNWDYLQTLENDMIRTIMNGEESIDTFDAFVEDWKDSGGDVITAEVREYLAEC